MNSTPWILIAIAILIIGLAIVAILYRKKYKAPPDYYAFFWIGIIWLIFGVPMKNYALAAIGAFFTILGLANKSKWKENQRRWDQLTPAERKFRIILIIVLGILVLAGLLVYILTESGSINL